MFLRLVTQAECSSGSQNPEILLFSKSERRAKRQLIHKPNSNAIVSTLTACFLLLILIYNDLCVRLCAHTENYKRVYYRNDWFFSHFLCGNVKIEEVFQFY
jgi:hypothetical protein